MGMECKQERGENRANIRTMVFLLPPHLTYYDTSGISQSDVHVGCSHGRKGKQQKASYQLDIYVYDIRLLDSSAVRISTNHCNVNSSDWGEKLMEQGIVSCQRDQILKLY